MREAIYIILFCHWMAGITGGIVGLRIAWTSILRRQKIDPARRSMTLVASLTGFFVTLLVAKLWGERAIQFELDGLRESITWAVIFFPPLLFVPGGFLGMAMGYLTAPWREPSSDEASERSHDAIDLSSRMAWMSFWFATAGAFLGYIPLIAYAWSHPEEMWYLY